MESRRVDSDAETTPFFANDESIPWPEFLSKPLRRHNDKNDAEIITNRKMQAGNIYLEKMNRSSRARPPVNLAAHLLPIIFHKSTRNTINPLD